KLAEDFASFDARDLQNLGRGEAVAKIGRSENDFDLRIPLSPPVCETEARENRERLIALSRERYARKREEVEKEIFEGLRSKAEPSPGGGAREEKREEAQRTKPEHPREGRQAPRERA